MDVNSLFSNGPLFALLGVIATVIINYLIQLTKGGTDMRIADRKILSEDQENFKKSILEQLKECRTAVDKLTEDNQTWQDKAILVQEQKLALTEKVIELNQQLLEMRRTIAELQDTIDEMKRNAGVEKNG